MFCTVRSVLSECLWKNLHMRLGRDSNPRPPYPPVQTSQPLDQRACPMTIGRLESHIAAGSAIKGCLVLASGDKQLILILSCTPTLLTQCYSQLSLVWFSCPSLIENLAPPPNIGENDIRLILNPPPPPPPYKMACCYHKNVHFSTGKQDYYWQIKNDGRAGRKR